MVEIKLIGEIVPKGRPRVGKNSVYTPKKTRDFETYVGLMAKSVIKKPFKKGVAVEIMVKKKPPQSWSKKRQKMAIEGKILASVRPDVDNYAKAILDGMDGIVFEDDGLIVDLKVSKKYSEKDGAIILVSEVEGENPY